MSKKSYNVHHGSFGAYASFLFGKVNKGGGFAVNDVASSNKNIYIGYKRNGVSLLPFCRLNNESKLEQFGLNSEENKESKDSRLFTEDELLRRLSFASDEFRAGDISFTVYNPFFKMKDFEELEEEERKSILAPGMVAKVVLDNTGSEEEAELLFGMELDTNCRILSENTAGKLFGGAANTLYGFAAAVEGKNSLKDSNGNDINYEEIRENIGWTTIEEILKGEERIQNHIGNEVVLSVKVPPACMKTLIIALGSYQDGIVTSGIKSRFAYTEHFKDLEEVLSYLLSNKDKYIKEARKLDKELEEKKINEYRKFLIAHGAHSYYASTELLKTKENKMVWVVNEGEYRMMNTFDLTVDHLFWEMEYHPWTIKNVMDLFVERYSYNEGIKDVHNKKLQGGLSFTHDMGVANMFTKQGYSSYERVNLDGCFSYMTAEQLLNWILTSTCYALKVKDEQWLNEKLSIFDQCVESLLARDYNGDGIIDCDSLRCGTGSEITTYDSLDVSLGQARNNLYLAVKTWAAYICLENVYKVMQNDEKIKILEARAKKISETLLSKFNKEEGYIPAVFENGNTSRIIPAIEGLVYPYYIGDKDAVYENGRYSKLVKLLKVHLNNILVKGICLDEISGGWKLSSTSYNTWMSKIFLSQYVAEEVLKMGYTEEQIAHWDKVHASWQYDSCDELCAVDQVDSRNGKDLGSRLYPRLVTSVLISKFKI